MLLLQKTIPIKENRNDHTKVIKYEDQSIVFSTSEETYILIRIILVEMEMVIILQKYVYEFIENRYMVTNFV